MGEGRGRAFSPAAKETLAAWGWSPAEWRQLWFGSRTFWGGDVCGCSDDRCANGFHHDAVEDCSCLEAMLLGEVRRRQAAV